MMQFVREPWGAGSSPNDKPRRGERGRRAHAARALFRPSGAVVSRRRRAPHGSRRGLPSAAPPGLPRPPTGTATRKCRALRSRARGRRNTRVRTGTRDQAFHPSDYSRPTPQLDQPVATSRQRKTTIAPRQLPRGDHQNRVPTKRQITCSNPAASPAGPGRSPRPPAPYPYCRRRPRRRRAPFTRAAAGSATGPPDASAVCGGFVPWLVGSSSTSTRRFLAIPAGVRLSAIGRWGRTRPPAPARRRRSARAAGAIPRSRGGPTGTSCPCDPPARWPGC